MQSILMAASAAALLHSTMVTSGPLIVDGSPDGPMPQNGVWALLPADCERPRSLDLRTWAKCATPIGFENNRVAALEKPKAGKAGPQDEFYAKAKTQFAIAAGQSAPNQANANPAIAQVVVPMVFSRSYYYIAIVPMELDQTGHFAEARGWPVSCAPEDQGGCIPKSLEDVYGQASQEPADPQRLYRLVRILPSSDGADSDPGTPLTPQPQAPVNPS